MHICSIHISIFCVIRKYLTTKMKPLECIHHNYLADHTSLRLSLSVLINVGCGFIVPLLFSVMGRILELFCRGACFSYVNIRTFRINCDCNVNCCTQLMKLNIKIWIVGKFLSHYDFCFSSTA